MNLYNIFHQNYVPCYYIWNPVGFESDEAVISGLRKVKALANFNLTKSRNLWFRDIQLMKIFPNTSEVGLRPDCYFDTHYFSVSRTPADLKLEGCCIILYILKITRVWFLPNGVTVILVLFIILNFVCAKATDSFTIGH